MLAIRKRAGWKRRQEPVPTGPTLNISDVPEMMPGAVPSANPVARERFNQRCLHLWQAEIQDGREASEVRAACQTYEAREYHSQLEKMFPNLDPELIWNLSQEALHPQDAVNTLLMLSAATSHAVSTADTGSSGGGVAGGGSAVTSDVKCTANASNTTMHAGPPSPQGTKQNLEDGGNWPTLVGSDGWEIVSYQRLEGKEHDLGSAWCDTAKDAAPLPSPKATTNEAALQPKRKKKHGVDHAKGSTEEGTPSVLTDYEVRHSRGKLRADRIASISAARSAKAPFHQSADSSESSDSDEDLISD